MNTPVQADEYGILYVPPAPPDPMPMYAAGVGLAAAAGVLLYTATRRGKEKPNHGVSQLREVPPRRLPGLVAEVADPGERPSPSPSRSAAAITSRIAH